MNSIKKIFCIQGVSGSGNDTLTNIVSKKLNIPMLISHTTRPIREGEIRDKTYHYVSDDFFKKEYDNFIEIRKYKVWNGETWYYGLHKMEILNKPYSFLIVDRQGYEVLKEVFGNKLVSIKIEVDNQELIKRLKRRGDNHKEISRRLEDDMRQFSNFKPDYKIYNNDLKRAIEEFKYIIKKEIE